MIKVNVVVGSGKPSTLADVYRPNAEAVVRDCLNAISMHKTIYTNDNNVMTAMRLLHGQGLWDVTILHAPSGIELELGRNGDMLSPWPDGLMEIHFDLLFHQDGIMQSLKETAHDSPE